MLASLTDASLSDPSLAYEPKYDGIRAIAEVPGGTGHVRLWSRLGNDKTHQFPEIATALEKWAKARREPLVLDGEVVALDAKGNPIGFQNLQGRIHLTDEPPPGSPTAFIVFDVLRDGAQDWRGRPFRARRAALEKLFSKTKSSILRISEVTYGDGRALYDRALASGWEGLIAKHVDSLYKSGKRTPDWRKLKIVHEQEFVIGGWTEPRDTRAYFGALLLGVYEPSVRGPDLPPSLKLRRTAEALAEAGQVGHLTYVGHAGTGFNERELQRLMKLFKPLETTACPFATRPPTNERPHWVEPKLVAQIKFTEWTADGKLRHPVYLGLRDDKRPTDVVRETAARFHGATMARVKTEATKAAPARVSEKTAARRPSGSKRKPATKVRSIGPSASDVESVVEQLQAIERGPGNGTVQLADGGQVPVTNLRKIFWPKQKFTKGDLFRYYAQVSPALLPAIADRPLVMKRFPNGIAAAPFYQHRAEATPSYVRSEVVKIAEQRTHVIGGDLATLLYTTQLASISLDPWFSRVQSPESADHAAIDLDPPDDRSFDKVLDVARWVHDELDALGATGFAKTSGSSGLHVYLPLPPGTPYEAGQILCQIIASIVAHKHPKQATLERAVRARGGRIYVDCLQNALGKTLATAYSARASDYAGVSAPLTWKEVEKGVDREDFTIVTMPERLKKVGDLWKGLRESKGIDLQKVADKANRR